MIPHPQHPNIMKIPYSQTITDGQSDNPKSVVLHTVSYFDDGRVSPEKFEIHERDVLFFSVVRSISGLYSITKITWKVVDTDGKVIEQSSDWVEEQSNGN